MRTRLCSIRILNKPASIPATVGISRRQALSAADARSAPPCASRPRPASSEWPWICCGANPRDCFPALERSSLFSAHALCPDRAPESCGPTPASSSHGASSAARCCGDLFFPSPLSGCPQVSHRVANIPPQSRGVKLSLRPRNANRIRALRICTTQPADIVERAPNNVEHAIRRRSSAASGRQKSVAPLPVTKIPACA